MHRRALIAALAASPLVSPTARAAGPALTGRRIVPYENAWRVSVRQGSGPSEARAISSDQVRAVTVAGKRWLSRVEGTTSIRPGADGLPSGGFSMTFNLFDPDTLFSRLGESRAASGDCERRLFERARVTITTHAGTGPDQIRTVATPEPAYDFNGGLTGLLLAAAPLEAGWAGAFPAVAEGFETVPVRVLGREAVAAGFAGRPQAWVVEVGAPGSGSRYWIGEAAPYVLRAETVNGASTAAWEMIGG